MTRRLTVPALVASLLLAGALPAMAQTTRPTTRPATAPHQQDRPKFARLIEQAQGGEVWDQKEALAVETRIAFGGNSIFEGTMTFATDFSGVRMERNDGAVAVWDGTSAWVAPAEAEFPRARFHLLTWSYFLAAPFKLDDPGTTIEPLGASTLLGREMGIARLTFDAGIGDAPDDWYILYMEPQSLELRGMAYIVTYGTPIEEAEQEPHAVVFDSFVDVEGVRLPTDWAFFNYNDEEGVHGEPIGIVRLDNPRFVERDPALFAKPDDATEDPLPAS